MNDLARSCVPLAAQRLAEIQVCGLDSHLRARRGLRQCRRRTTWVSLCTTRFRRSMAGTPGNEVSRAWLGSTRRLDVQSGHDHPAWFFLHGSPLAPEIE